MKNNQHLCLPTWILKLFNGINFLWTFIVLFTKAIICIFFVLSYLKILNIDTYTPFDLDPSFVFGLTSIGLIFFILEASKKNQNFVISYVIFFTFSYGIAFVINLLSVAITSLTLEEAQVFEKGIIFLISLIFFVLILIKSK